MSNPGTRARFVSMALMLMGAGAAGYFTFTLSPEPPVDGPVTQVAVPAASHAPSTTEIVGGPGYVPAAPTNLPASTRELNPAKPDHRTSDTVPQLDPSNEGGNDGSEAQQPLAEQRSPADEESEDTARAAERRVQIQEQMRSQMPAFRDCYELILELEPELDDRLVLELEVEGSEQGGTGTTLLAIEASRMDIGHLECFAEAASALQMPAPEDGADSYTIRYPIILQSQ